MVYAFPRSVYPVDSHSPARHGFPDAGGEVSLGKTTMGSKKKLVPPKALKHIEKRPAITDSVPKIK
jgi:hypothetical protein